MGTVARHFHHVSRSQILRLWLPVRRHRPIQRLCRALRIRVWIWLPIHRLVRQLRISFWIRIPVQRIPVQRRIWIWLSILSLWIRRIWLWQLLWSLWIWISILLVRQSLRKRLCWMVSFTDTATVHVAVIVVAVDIYIHSSSASKSSQEVVLDGIFHADEIASICKL